MPILIPAIIHYYKVPKQQLVYIFIYTKTAYEHAAYSA